MWMWNGTVTLENSMVVPEKIENRTKAWFSNSTSGYIPMRIENVLMWYVYTYIYSSVAHNSSNKDATQMATDR